MVIKDGMNAVERAIKRLFIFWNCGVVAGILDCIYKLASAKRWQCHIQAGTNWL